MRAGKRVYDRCQMAPLDLARTGDAPSVECSADGRSENGSSLSRRMPTHDAPGRRVPGQTGLRGILPQNTFLHIPMKALARTSDRKIRLEPTGRPAARAFASQRGSRSLTAVDEERSVLARDRPVLVTIWITRLRQRTARRRVADVNREDVGTGPGDIMTRHAEDVPCPVP